MPTYRYSAYRQNGAVASGTVDAASDAEALRRINELGLLPFATEVQAAASAVIPFWKREIRFTRSVSLSERSRFVRELATLLGAGIAVDQALRVLSSEERRSRLAPEVHGLFEDVRAGRSLSEALRTRPEAFGDELVQVVRAGEASGSLGAVLEDLAKSMERRAEMGSRIASQLVYPAVLVVMALVAVAVILAVLVPSLAPVFENAGAELPFVARATMSVYELSLAVWLALAAVLIGLAFAARQALRQPGVREAVDRSLLRVAVFGRIVADIEAIRFARTLALLMRTGVPLLKALAIAGDAARNQRIKSALSAAAEKVRAGKRLPEALSTEGVFDGSFLQLLRIGDDTNRLEAMLTHLAEIRQAELERRLEGMMALLTPLLTAIIGLVVGGLILSVMQAIMSLNELAL